MTSLCQIQLKWSLASKNYVVTGGTKGIGLAVIKSLLSNGARSVLFCARNQSDVDSTVQSLENEFPDANGSLYGVACDISTKDGRDTLVLFAKGCNEDQGVHGLINNVGINIRETALDQTKEEYHRIMSTNIDSTYFLCKLFHPLLLKAATASAQSSACVVNVASCAGLMSSGTGAAYGMSKAAMISLTKSLSCEWAKSRIRVNAVAPWMTMTPMLEDAVKNNPGALDKVKEWTPMQRLASAQEVADPVVFLCMPCSSYITGQCLAIDGGLSAQGFDGPCVTP